MVRKGPVAVIAILLLGFFGVSGQGDEDTGLAALIAGLSERASTAAFTDQVLSASRGRGDIHEALSLLKALTPKAQAQLRKPLLREQALLLEFLERWLDAAALWQEAAATPPGAGDADSLVNAGLAYLLGGDNARALAVATAVKTISAEAAILDKARLIAGWAQLLSDDRGAAYAEANAVLEAGRKETRLAAFDLAWAAGDAENAASLWQRRQAEYPQMASAIPHPRYAILSLAGKAQLWLAEDTPGGAPGQPTSSQSGTVQKSAAASVAALPSAERKASDDTASPSRYQVGAFKDPANAEAARKRLADKGLAASVVIKKQGADSVAVVYVAAGGDPARTLIGIKDAGFEAWPLYDQP
jgi:tetratricopeptide (TPR) repeat protein